MYAHVCQLALCTQMRGIWGGGGGDVNRHLETFLLRGGGQGSFPVLVGQPARQRVCHMIAVELSLP